jgi:hypothetical protein
MRTMMARMIKTLLPKSGEEQVRRIVGVASIAQRYGIMQMLCEISMHGVLGSAALEGILARAAGKFPTSFDAASAIRSAAHLSRILEAKGSPNG